MKRVKLLAALGLATCGIGASLPAFAQDNLPLAYMRAGDYRDLDHQEKVSLVKDFMRTFCGSLTMPVVPFVQCIDEAIAEHSAGQPIFADLKACIRMLS